MGFPIFASNHVVLILPYILILALVWERWPRYRYLRVGFLFLLVLLIPFGLYYRVVTVYDPLVIDLISALRAERIAEIGNKGSNTILHRHIPASL